MIHTRGLTQAQAAIELGCSVQNVWKHLGNAEKKLAAKAASRSISQSKKIPEDNRGQLNVGKRVIDED
jgi:DNA-directed RNA polymerase specialized sigma24 family protein